MGSHRVRPFKSLCHWLQVWLMAYSRYQCSSVGNQPDWWCSWPSCSFHFVSGIGVRTAAIWGREEFWDPGCPSFYWLKPHSPHADNCGSWSAALGSAPLISWGSDRGEEELVIVAWVSGPRPVATSHITDVELVQDTPPSTSSEPWFENPTLQMLHM